jgi:NADH dehydrogenase/NADH:ubiquinone oxidoreductase subunit G
MTEPSEALRIAADMLGSLSGSRIAVVLSAQHTTEDNLAAVKLAEALGSDKLYLAAHPAWQGDDILRHTDANPNRRGLEQAAGGRKLGSLGDLARAAEAAEISAAVMLGGTCAESAQELAVLSQLPTLALAAHHGVLTELSAIVVPVSAHGEHDGTFTNAKGIAQRFHAAVPPPEGVRPAWQTVVALAGLLGKSLGANSLAELRRGLSAPAAAQQARV